MSSLSGDPREFKLPLTGGNLCKQSIPVWDAPMTIWGSIFLSEQAASRAPISETSASKGSLREAFEVWRLHGGFLELALKTSNCSIKFNFQDNVFCFHGYKRSKINYNQNII